MINPSPALSVTYVGEVADFNADSVPANTTAMLSCARGYTLTSTDNTTCNTSGMWHPPASTCQREYTQQQIS